MLDTNQFRIGADPISDALFLLEPDGDAFRCAHVDAAYTKLTGLMTARLTGKRLDDSLPAAQAALLTEKCREAVCARTSVSYEERVVANGREVTVITRLIPQFDQAGHCVRLIGTMSDITERRNAASALQEAAEQYRLLFEGNPNPMWVYDRETLAFLAVNDAAVAHYGYSREEFLGMTLADIRLADDLAQPPHAVAGSRRAACRQRVASPQEGRHAHPGRDDRQQPPLRRAGGASRPRQRRDRAEPDRRGAARCPRRVIAPLFTERERRDPHFDVHSLDGSRGQSSGRPPCRRCTDMTQENILAMSLLDLSLDAGPIPRRLPAGDDADECSRRDLRVIGQTMELHRLRKDGVHSRWTSSSGHPSSNTAGARRLLQCDRPRYHRTQAGGGGTARREGGGGCRQPRQEPVPRQHEPRDPHADERRDRHDRAAARHPADARAAGVRRDDPHERRRPADDHQRHPRLLEDRIGQPRSGGAALRPARLRRGRARSARRLAPPRRTSSSPI